MPIHSRLPAAALLAFIAIPALAQQVEPPHPAPTIQTPDQIKWASRPGGSPTELTDLATDIVNQTRQSIRVEIRAAVGSIADGLSRVPRSRWEADQVLRIHGGLWFWDESYVISRKQGLG